MNASTKFGPQLVRITIAQNSSDKSFGVFSEDMPGLFVTGKDISKVIEQIPEVIRMLYKLDCGLDVEVTPAVPPLPYKVAARSHTEALNEFTPIVQQYVIEKQLAA